MTRLNGCRRTAEKYKVPPGEETTVSSDSGKNYSLRSK